MSVQPNSPLLDGTQLGSAVAGFQLLANARLTAAATTISVPDLPLRQFLLVVVSMLSMSGSFPRLRLGTTAGSYDSGANYWSRNMEGVENGNIVPGNYNNTGAGNDTYWQLAYNSTAGGTRLALLSIFNNPTRVTGQWAPTLATGSAATIGRMASGWGEWFSGPVRAMQLSTVDGASTYGVGSGFAVFGRDF